MTQDEFNDKVLTLGEDLVGVVKSLQNRVDACESSLAWAGLAIFLLSVAFICTLAMR